jgi:hypothetical protein
MSQDAVVILKNRLQQILQNKNLSGQRELIRDMAAELSVDELDYAAALLYLTHARIKPKAVEPPIIITTSAEIKMLRYRLAVGVKQKINAEQLKKVLIDEAGVDRKLLTYINIQEDYTVVELPDAMPTDIFQHLKTVEINQHKLDIKRLKQRSNKKRGRHPLRRGRLRSKYKEVTSV